MASPQAQPQSVLADRYVIEREIGRGGMATVYLAEDRKHRRHVAVKILHPHLAANLGSERFHREVEIAARLSHPTFCRSTIPARPMASCTMSCRSCRESPFAAG